SWSWCDAWCARGWCASSPEVHHRRVVRAPAASVRARAAPPLLRARRPSLGASDEVRRSLGSRGMEQRALGPADFRVSVVTFGAMGFGPPGPEEDARRVDVIRAALDAGVTAIDTAPLYGFGRSERVVARAIAGLRRRP